MKKAILGIVFLWSLTACNDDFLDAKSDKALVVPRTIENYQALLDDVSQQINQTPGYMDFAVDDYILPENGLAGEGEDINHVYLWNREGIVNLETNNDWNRIYAQILRANIVLEGLESLMSQSHESAFKEAKGGALFFRSWHFFHLIQLFSKPYNPQTSKTDPGIVLKLKADINENAGITSVETCYKQIIKDLEEALELLPDRAQVVSRPDRASTSALLARVYLSRFEYDLSEKYADLSLSINSALLDFNEVENSFPDPFSRQNPEILFYSIPILRAYNFYQKAQIDTNLLKLYDTRDLRLSAFFKFDEFGNAKTKASYFANALLFPFTGITSGEMYLIKAESLVRKGHTKEGLDVLNFLRKFRMDKSYPYSDLITSDKRTALIWILEERRKELFFKGLRWFDLRRLNNDEEFQIVLTRVYNDKEYVLLPKADFYDFPIPLNEKKLNPSLSD